MRCDGDAGQELLDLVERRLCVANPVEMVCAWEFDVTRIGKVLAEVAPEANPHVAVLSVVDDQSRCLHQPQKGPSVEVADHQLDRCRRPGAD